MKKRKSANQDIARKPREVVPTAPDWQLAPEAIVNRKGQPLTVYLHEDGEILVPLRQIRPSRREPAGKCLLTDAWRLLDALYRELKETTFAEIAEASHLIGLDLDRNTINEHIDKARRISKGLRVRVDERGAKRRLATARKVVLAVAAKIWARELRTDAAANSSAITNRLIEKVRAFCKDRALAEMDIDKVLSAPI